SAIVEEARGRRVFPAAPDRSLLLLKATAQVPHGGGKRIEVDSEPYRIMRQWIETGMPPASADAPKLVKLHVQPLERVMEPGERQQLAVEAEYSDGRMRDVTHQTEFSSNLGVVAAVDSDALVTATGQSGEAAVMARYMGQVAVFRVMVPHGQPLAEIPNFS